MPVSSEIIRQLEEWAVQESQTRWLQFYLGLLRIQSEFERHIPIPEPLSQETVDECIKLGNPLISYVKLDIDWSRLQDTYKEIVDLISEYAELFEKVPPGFGEQAAALLTPEKVQACLHGENWSDLPYGISINLWRNMIHATFAPVLATYSRVLLEKVNQEQWRRGFCPICGGHPDLAVLDDEVGARWLICSRCDARWRFQRLECPYCGCKDQNALAYFTDEKGHYQLYTCEKCRRYIKAIDQRQAKSEILIPLERLLTFNLDEQAREFGYLSGLVE